MKIYGEKNTTGYNFAIRMRQLNIKRDIFWIFTKKSIKNIKESDLFKK